MVCCILGNKGRVGIDLEILDDRYFDVMDIVFTNEERKFVDSKIELSEKQKAFYLVWTRKEAYLKAIGKGFLADPKLIKIPLGEYIGKTEGFSFYTFQPKSKYIISIAVEGDIDMSMISIQKIR